PQARRRGIRHLDDVEVVPQRLHVAGGARARLAQRRRVERYANRSYPSRKTSPVLRQEKLRACSIPFARSSSRRVIASRMPEAIASGLSGSARTAASPEASSIDSWAEATTGAPEAIASVIGMPKPSKREG